MGVAGPLPWIPPPHPPNNLSKKRNGAKPSPAKPHQGNKNGTHALAASLQTTDIDSLNISTSHGRTQIKNHRRPTARCNKVHVEARCISAWYNDVQWQQARCRVPGASWCLLRLLPKHMPQGARDLLQCEVTCGTVGIGRIISSGCRLAEHESAASSVRRSAVGLLRSLLATLARWRSRGFPTGASEPSEPRGPCAARGRLGRGSRDRCGLRLPMPSKSGTNSAIGTRLESHIAALSTFCDKRSLFFGLQVRLSFSSKRSEIV